MGGFSFGISLAQRNLRLILSNALEVVLGIDIAISINYRYFILSIIFILSIKISIKSVLSIFLSIKPVLSIFLSIRMVLSIFLSIRPVLSIFLSIIRVLSIFSIISISLFNIFITNLIIYIHIIFKLNLCSRKSFKTKLMQCSVL